MITSQVASFGREESFVGWPFLGKFHYTAEHIFSLKPQKLLLTHFRVDEFITVARVIFEILEVINLLFND